MPSFTNVGIIKNELYLFVVDKRDIDIVEIEEIMASFENNISSDGVPNDNLIVNIKYPEKLLKAGFGKTIYPIGLDYDIEFTNGGDQLPIFHLKLYNADNIVNKTQSLIDDGNKYYFVLFAINRVAYFVSNLHSSGRYQQANDVTTVNEFWFTYSKPSIFDKYEQFLLTQKANSAKIEPIFDPFDNYLISSLKGVVNDRDKQLLFKTGYIANSKQNKPDTIPYFRDKERELKCLLQIIEEFRKPIENRLVYVDLGKLYQAAPVTLFRNNILDERENEIFTKSPKTILAFLSAVNKTTLWLVTTEQDITRNAFNIAPYIVDLKVINTGADSKPQIECLLNGNVFIDAGYLIKFEENGDKYRITNVNIQFSTYESKFIYYIKAEGI